MLTIPRVLIWSATDGRWRDIHGNTITVTWSTT